MSDFVIYSSNGDAHGFSGDSQYRFRGDGHLEVTSDQGMRRIYSPNGWIHLDEEAPPNDRPVIGGIRSF